MIYFKANTQFMCPRCGASFPRFHSIGWTQVRCDNCSVTFAYRGRFSHDDIDIWQDEIFPA